ncbi:hypothetical protein Taro_043419 [Colocasia esculenta]|uniref:Uncharacterized protein n=1 Tax=Colocasia esculenta TaxID=4460 RepID=A0A843X1H3_COLES|nr:hypothetical protein [Colocasia esculenta]
MERFKRMLPPSFKGERDPLLTESWMREIGKIFRAIRCADDDKVTLATYMLQERADVWWSSLLRTRFEGGAVESTSVDADPKSAATSMDANPILTARDLDVYLPDQMHLQIQKCLRICHPLIRKSFPNGNLAYPLCFSDP